MGVRQWYLLVVLFVLTASAVAGSHAFTKEVWSRMDGDGDKLVTKDELKTFLAGEMEKRHQQETERQWRLHRLGPRDKLTFDQFCTYSISALLSSAPVEGPQWRVHRLGPRDKLTFDQYEKRAYKGEPDPAHLGRVERMKQEERRRFAASDKDQDGGLNKEEFRAFLYPREHDHMHGHLLQDGKLSRSEVAAHPDVLTPLLYKASTEGAMDVLQCYLLAAVLVFATSLEAGHKATSDEVWSRMDADGDGLATRDELKSFTVGERVRDLRKDTEKQWKYYGLGPGEKLTFERYAKKTYPKEDKFGHSSKTKEQERRRFHVSDANNDGALDKDEFMAFEYAEEYPHMHDIVMLETMEDMDKNGDGVLNFAEFTVA
uniref:Reticulocalbin-3 n=1 Tax=Branchiostoma floridae TaxID=7739 RepID=C3ZKE6_BRAFL|eukprot:XP_002591034.1 hypothetical protein BRAFLDRAFT_69413 [Branchiostoma floridae]